MGRTFYFLSDFSFKCKHMQVFSHLLPDFLLYKLQALLELLRHEKNSCCKKEY